MNNPFNHLLTPGHRGCAGCGQNLAVRHVIDILGRDTIIANATGCLEVTTTPYPQSAWMVPWIHSLFENASALASGIKAALNHQGKKTKVAVFSGDGGAFDIGYGLISGMWERGEDILYVCFDNEAYMNTGDQGSGATPYGAATTTTPADSKTRGNQLFKKDMPALAMAHNVVYTATSVIGYPMDIEAKVKKSLTFSGPKYLQILTGCTPGWGYASHLTLALGRLAQQTGLYPVFEAEKGKIIKVMKVPNKSVKVEEYLKPQKRFAHLFKEENKKELVFIQKIAEENIRKYNLR